MGKTADPGGFRGVQGYWMSRKHILIFRAEFESHAYLGVPLTLASDDRRRVYTSDM